MLVASVWPSRPTLDNSLDGRLDHGSRRDARGKAGGFDIDVRERVLTLTGRATLPDRSKEWDVLREYESGMFFRQFTLSETIDPGKIDARLADGVLRLELPKVEKARPRKITVRSE